MKFKLLLVICWGLLVGCASSNDVADNINTAEPEIFNLYPGDIPGAKSTVNLEHVRDISHPDTFLMDITLPTLTAYWPEPAKANGTAVIICPGGGYAGVSIVKEGSQVAERFNQLGVTAFVLKYRMPLTQSMQDKSLGPLQDVQQAISLVRKNAQSWHIDADKVGIMGFSAGGHLTASAAVHFDNPVTAELAEHNIRPDFQILIYPVISFMDEITHKGSRDNLIGPAFSPEQSVYFSNERQVTDNTPPAFIVHAGDDTSVPVENSLVYYQALHRHQVPSQLLIVPDGGHGFGLRNNFDWFNDLERWLRNRGLLSHTNLLSNTL
ncbi:alpha/beta hydrolase [Neptunicella sp. SCSIO 80796]|uniref:alpha/beta hydrolase n=1 Tax=Neptunicella plasticusilytica TaxID=3117012 RepID=UPI003A4E4BBB